MAVVRSRAWAVCGAVLITAAAVHAQPDTAGPPASPMPRESRGLGPAAPAMAGTSAKAERGAAGGGWLSQALPLAAVLALAIGAGWVVKVAAKRGGALVGGGRAPAGILEVLGRYPVGRGSTLVLLKLDRRVLLLSQSSMGKLGMGSSFSTLCEVTDPDEVASILVKTRDADGDSMAEKFRSMLTRFDRSMPEVAEETSRGRRETPAGDRVELWSEARAEATPAEPAEGGGAVTSLRRRLASVRWPSEEGGLRP